MSAAPAAPICTYLKLCLDKFCAFALSQELTAAAEATDAQWKERIAAVDASRLAAEHAASREQARHTLGPGLFTSAPAPPLAPTPPLRNA